ncbi:uncharacterized protein LOC143025513 isoform X2 [Oratosquilla oratoria]|uniref:uncharacterized protein LOC143025513 isoform X2 n=1 Tax=Oratosquilla oratoria TaxID=337810 RepID=UPI003F7621A8
MKVLMNDGLIKIMPVLAPVDDVSEGEKMSWFDTTGLASFAKTALKGAQRTIDKALDIQESQENSPPTTRPPPKSASLTEKLKDEAEDFFATYGLAEKKSPLTPANSPESPKPPSALQSGDEEEESKGTIMAGSLWGSFSGSFFENPLSKKTQEDTKQTDSSTGCSSSENVVAKQPPRTSVPLMVAPTSSQPVARHSIVTEDMDLLDGKASMTVVREEQGSREWAWGWDSSMFSGSKSSVDDDTITTDPDLEGRGEASLDDTVDLEGFSRSRLVVGSVDSDAGGLSRQESIVSIGGRLADGTLAVSNEDVFEGDGTERNLADIHEDHLGQEEEKESPYDNENKDEAEDKILGVSSSCSSYEVNTPDSIVVLASSTCTSNSSPETDTCEKTLNVPGSCPKLKVGLDLDIPSSPFSSPDSIEVLGPSSAITSPSSVEILSDPSSENSSPTHQASLTTPSDSQSQDTVISQQPTADINPSKHLILSPGSSTLHTPSPLSENHSFSASQNMSFSQSIEVVSESKTPEECMKEENIGSAVEIKVKLEDEAGSIVEVKECAEGKDGIHSLEGSTQELFSSQSTSTCSTLDSSITVQGVGTPQSFEFSVSPSQNVRSSEVVKEKLVKELPSIVCKEPVPERDIEVCEKTSPVESVVANETDETAVGKSSVNLEGSSEFDNSGTTSAPLNMSIESGGSSDTITASIDSSLTSCVPEIEMTLSQEDGTKQELRSQEEEGDRGTKASGKTMTASSSAGSFVRCLLEEAMGDEDDGTGESISVVTSPGEREQSPSSSERSEAPKISSGHTSCHSSGDEMETTTSSDIEVISSPSVDGNGARGLTAGRVSWGSRRPHHSSSLLPDRSDSPASDQSTTYHKRMHAEKGETVSSSMTTSFTSISESDGDSNNQFLQNLNFDSTLISQVLQDMVHFEKGHRRNQSSMSETSESSSEHLSPDAEKLIKKISQLNELVEARESKLMELSQMNAALQDTNFNLKTRLEELEGRGGHEATESVREEYTQRLGNMERKFQQALREKEAIKKQLEEVRAEVATRLSSIEVARELEERDSTIKELREEGEKLSRQQLNYSTLIKKLRSKEKENEVTLKAQKDKLEDNSRELERLRKQLSAKEEVERRQIEAIRQLTMTRQQLEREFKDTRAENAELEGKMSVLKEALDTAYRELAEMQRTVATKDMEVQEHALSAEMGARQQLEAALTECKLQAKREQDALIAELHQLQDSHNQYETHANRQENRLKAEISELQQRVAEAESRAEELSSAVSAATRPLLRQMENLQSTHSVQQASWEALEANLTQRINESQVALSNSLEKERAAREQCVTLSSQVASLETQTSTLRAEKNSLTTQMEMASTKLDTYAEMRTKETSQLEALKASFAEEIAEVKRERDILEQQLDIEKTAMVAEKKKCASLLEQLKEKDHKIMQQGSSESRHTTPRSSPTPSLSRISFSGSFNESFSGSQWGHDDVFEGGSGARALSLYDSMRSNSAVTVDALTSQLRQREGEVHHLQSEIVRYEAQRSSLAHELLGTASEVEELKMKLEHHSNLKQQYIDLEKKYNALLQMYGEKVEEVEELRLDLADVKEMYKAQIDQLMQK